MIKEYYSPGFCLLVVLSCLFVIPSCTYDYFEDETNYVVYVPKADKALRTDSYSIEDLSILIYNGTLAKERYSYNPFAENARSMSGNFNFRLYPGLYSVYCFTGVQETNFQDIHSHDQARFDLQQFTDGTYMEPSAIYVEYKAPTIHFPGPVVYDTARFERKYVGRICIAFKNLTRIGASLTYDNIKRIDIEASGVGVTQYLSALTDSTTTRSSRNSAEDIMRLSADVFDVGYKDFDFGIENYYFPSPDLSPEGRQNEPIYLKLTFIGHDNSALSALEIPLTDASGPVILHMNETLVVEVDGNNIRVLRLGAPEEWNPDIEQEGDTGPGSGGIGV